MWVVYTLKRKSEETANSKLYLLNQPVPICCRLLFQMTVQSGTDEDLYVLDRDRAIEIRPKFRGSFCSET